MGTSIAKAAFARSGGGLAVALDGSDIRIADASFAAIDLNPKAGTFYTGHLRTTLAPALADLGSIYCRASTAWHMGPDKLLVSYGQDGAALAYQFAPSLAIRGLTIERSSYNVVTASTGTGPISGGSGLASTGVSANAGPDGTLSMATVTSNAADGYAQSGNYALPADNAIWCFSFVVPKTATANVVKLTAVLTGGSGQVLTATLNTLTGAVASGNGFVLNDGYGVIDQGNFWLLWTSNAIGTNSGVQIRFTPVSAGVGTADYGWVQVEPGATPTSRIKTVGTAKLRRERDSLTIPAAALAGAGTIEVTASPPGGTATTRVLAQIDDGTAANRATIQRTSAGNIQVLWVSAGSTIATMDLGAHAARSETRVAIGWNGTTLKAIRDGGGLIEAAAAPPAGLKTLRLGGDAATSSLDGPVARVAAWPGLRTDVFYEAPSASFNVYGDSMAAGSGVSTVPEHWNDILAANLKRGYVNYGVGGSTSSQMLANWQNNLTTRNWTLLLYTGHNSPDPVQTVADISATLARATVDPARRRFLIGLPTISTASAPGSAGALAILATRTAILANWPNNVVDVPAALAAGAPGDANLANGWSPSVYLADAIHLNAAGQVVEAAAWQAKLLAMGW